MSSLHFTLPEQEASIIWRYLDGVSRALARRFGSGSSPGEENLTFLLCELLDEGTTGLHLLEYPLRLAKDDLAKADGGITLDVTFQTHEHTKHTEHHFSGADIGVCFVIDHALFGRSQKAVLLQAKRLFPEKNGDFTLRSGFSSFHTKQRDLLIELEGRFSAWNSIYYLWYSPSSQAFSQNDAKLIQAIEATTSYNWEGMLGQHPFLDEIIEWSPPLFARWRSPHRQSADSDHQQQEWRQTQPATRVSSLQVVNSLTKDGRCPSLASLYKARTQHRRRRHMLPFEPFAELFFLALVSDRIGSSSPNWLRLARGEKVPVPQLKTSSGDVPNNVDLPETLTGPRHTLTFTLRSTLQWSEDLLAAQ